MKQLFTYFALGLVGVMLIAAIGNDQSQSRKPVQSPSTEFVQDLTSPEGEAMVELTTPEGNQSEAQSPENFTEQALLILNKTSVKGLSLKEKIALKVVRGKLKKDVRRIKKGKKTTGGDSQLIALLLCFFFGAIGIHRFYLGYIGIGLLELFTGGLCGILTFIDFIRIILGTLGPKDGEYASTL